MRQAQAQTSHKRWLLYSSGTHVHFLFNCPALEPTRAQFIHSITLAQPNFVFNTPTQQINYLYFNEHLSNNILDISANMLSVLYETRNKLMCLKQKYRNH